MRVRFVGRSGLALSLGAAIALSGCEIGIYGHGRAVNDACAPWTAGCPVVVDAAGDGPVEARRSDVEEAAIVEAAEAAPVRQCMTVPLACQAGTIGDVIVDHYVAQF